MRILRIIACLLALASAASAKEFKLYAMLLDDTPADLADGSRWQMDKGDVFPVLMYKEMQTKVVLQLAGTSFLTEASRVRILKESEVPAALANYRKNLQAYLNSNSDKWKKEAHEKKPKPDADAR